MFSRSPLLLSLLAVLFVLPLSLSTARADDPDPEEEDRLLIEVLERAGVPKGTTIRGADLWRVDTVSCVHGFTGPAGQDDDCTFFVGDEVFHTDSDDDAEIFIGVLDRAGVEPTQGFRGDVWVVSNLSCERGFTGLLGREHVCTADF